MTSTALHLTSTLLLLLGIFPAPLAAQATVSGLSSEEATLGTRFDVFGDGFGTKPKVFLTQGNQKVKKTKLKVISVTEDGAETQTLRVEVRKAVVGTFQIGVQPKGGAMVFSMDTLEIVLPSIISVTPGSAAAGDTVVARVNYAGNRKLRAEIFKKAKVLEVTPVLDEGGGSDFSDVQLRVPNVPAGTYNVVVRNKLGAATSKSALTVTGGSGCPGKPRAAVLVDGMLFKTKKVSVSEVADGLLITASRGGKNGQVLDVLVPFDPTTDSAPQVYVSAPASIEYVKSSGGVETGRWKTASGDGYQVIVNAFECDTIVVTVCGPLTPVGAEGGGSLPFEGTLIARLPKVVNPPLACNEMFGQVGGVAFLADFVVGSYLPDFTTTLIAGIDTPLGAAVSVDLFYNAFTQGAMVFDTFSATGLRLFQYTDNGEDFFAFAPVPGQPGSSVTFEILENDGSCITGLFSGSVKRPITGEVRTFNTFHFMAPIEIIN